MSADNDTITLLTLEEGGVILRTSRSSMYRLTREGLLEYTKATPGGPRMTTRRWIAEYIERCTVPARNAS